MQVDILATTINDKPIFSHLIELYLYDFSIFMGWDVGDDGRFGDDDLEGCWIEAWRHPFLVKVNTKLAGFAIVDHKSNLTGDPTVGYGRIFYFREISSSRNRNDSRHTVIHSISWQLGSTPVSSKCRCYEILALGN